MTRKVVWSVLLVIICFDLMQNVRAAFVIENIFGMVKHFKLNSSSHILTEYDGQGIHECAIRCLPKDECLGIVFSNSCTIIGKILAIDTNPSDFTVKEITAFVKIAILSDYVSSKEELNITVSSIESEALTTQSSNGGCSTMVGEYCLLDMEPGTSIDGTAAISQSDVKVGSGALSLEGEWARFGPFPDLCFSSVSACTEGFTTAFWIKMLPGCNGFILSTRDNNGYDGLQMSCDNSGFSFTVVLAGSSSQTSVSFSANVWVRVVMGGNIPGSITIRLGGSTVTVSASGSHGIPSNTGQIVFGREWVTTSGSGSGRALIDDVRFYNRQSAADEI